MINWRKWKCSSFNTEEEKGEEEVEAMGRKEKRVFLARKWEKRFSFARFVLGEKKA